MKGFSKELAMWLWNIAVSLAPYDTGNLRRGITLNNSSNNKITVVYNAYTALYLHYLEEGMGSVKKHKGFISELTVGAFVQEIIFYIQTLKRPLIVSKPMTTLRVSEQGAMFYEKRILNAIGFSKTSLITADDRQKLSNLRYMSKFNTGYQRVSGLKTDIRRIGFNKSQNLPIMHAFIDNRDY
jgi:hypothetical protein